MRFLIVDDDQNCRKIMQFFLRPYGEIIAVANGNEALAQHLQALTENKPFDIVYLDMVMPDLNGLEFLEILRNREKEHAAEKAVPVVMLSGNSQTSNINVAKSFGVVEYLLKPICEKRLIQGLERLELIDPNS